jgi:hypothetical protein
VGTDLERLGGPAAALVSGPANEGPKPGRGLNEAAPPGASGGPIGRGQGRDRRPGLHRLTTGQTLWGAPDGRRDLESRARGGLPAASRAPSRNGPLGSI